MIWEIKNCLVRAEIIYSAFLFKTWPTFKRNFVTLGEGKINHKYLMICLRPRHKTFQCLLGHKTIFLQNTTQSLETSDFPTHVSRQIRTLMSILFSLDQSISLWLVQLVWYNCIRINNSVVQRCFWFYQNNFRSCIFYNYYFKNVPLKKMGIWRFVCNYYSFP